MKETNELLDQLDLAYEPTPEAFHRRVQNTLAQMKTSNVHSGSNKRIRWAALLAACLMLFSAIAVATNMNRIIAFITNTMAKNWVLDDAQNLLHTNAASAALDECSASVEEWMCDGETLYVSILLTDPELQYTESDDHYLSGLNSYALYHGPQDVQLSEGLAHSASWDFARADEHENGIIYTLEIPIEVSSADGFIVSIPVVCSAGKMNLNFDVQHSDYGLIRMFEPSAILKADGYAAQITHFKVTALRSYATLKISFDESTPEERRYEIATDYLEGLGVPEGKLNAIAGEGQEIVMPNTATWSEDGLTCTLELRGNPFEEYPETIFFCPRWGMYSYEGEGTLPPLSMEGAVTMRMKEVQK